MVNDELVIEVVPHCIDVKEPGVPLYNWISGLVKLAPRLLTVTVLMVLAAVNLYHTSQWLPADSQPTGRLPLTDDAKRVPPVVAQEDPGVSVTADTGSSLGEVTKQIS
jgi:hypothetical protein